MELFNTRRQNWQADGARRVALRSVLCGAIAGSSLVSGCAVVTVASAVASVAATAASTVVDVGVGAVRVTGKVIGKGVDLVTGSPPSPSSSSSSSSSPVSTTRP